MTVDGIWMLTSDEPSAVLAQIAKQMNGIMLRLQEGLQHLTYLPLAVFQEHIVEIQKAPA